MATIGGKTSVIHQSFAHDGIANKVLLFQAPAAGVTYMKIVRSLTRGLVIGPVDSSLTLRRLNPITNLFDGAEDYTVALAQTSTNTGIYTGFPFVLGDGTFDETSSGFLMLHPSESILFSGVNNPAANLNPIASRNFRLTYVVITES